MFSESAYTSYTVACMCVCMCVRVCMCVCLYIYIYMGSVTVDGRYIILYSDGVSRTKRPRVQGRYLLPSPQHAPPPKRLKAIRIKQTDTNEVHTHSLIHTRTRTQTYTCTPAHARRNMENLHLNKSPSSSSSVAARHIPPRGVTMAKSYLHKSIFVRLANVTAVYLWATCTCIYTSHEYVHIIR